MYETTVAWREYGYGLHFVVVPPTPDMGEHGNELDLYGAADHLDLQAHEPVRIADIPDMLTAMLAHSPGDGTDELDLSEMLRHGEDLASEDLRKFAEYAAFGDVFATEGSALALHSLGAVAAKGGIVASGSTLGVVAAGPTPLLLVTVPLGIVLVGAATGVAQALQYGLRQKILQRLGVDQPSEAGVGV